MNAQRQSELKVFSLASNPARKITWQRICIKQKFQQRHQQASPTASSNTSQNCLKKLCRNRNLSIMCLQLISFIDRHIDHWNWTNSRFYQEGFPLQNIKTTHQLKHSEMGQEHLIKTITHSRRVGAKVMKQSKKVLPRRKEGRDFFRL